MVWEHLIGEVYVAPRADCLAARWVSRRKARLFIPNQWFMHARVDAQAAHDWSQHAAQCLPTEHLKERLLKYAGPKPVLSDTLFSNINGY